jgi:hypothetical protein
MGGSGALSRPIACTLIGSTYLNILQHRAQCLGGGVRYGLILGRRVGKVGR